MTEVCAILQGHPVAWQAISLTFVTTLGFRPTNIDRIGIYQDPSTQGPQENATLLPWATVSGSRAHIVRHDAEGFQLNFGNLPWVKAEG